MSCVNCETLKYNIQNLENMIATLEQENRQQHARNVRLVDELQHAEQLVGELREAAHLPYAKVRESFSR